MSRFPGAAAPDTNEEFWDLVNVYWPIALAVFTIVVVALIAVGLRFRSDADEYPQGRHEWPALEYGYAALIGLIAAFLIYLTFSTMGRLGETAATASGRHPNKPDGALVVDVIASQWGWRFVYPGGVRVVGDNKDWPTLRVPVERPVHFRITSADVVHSFWIQERKVKVDAFPGRTNTLNLAFPRTGYWRAGGRCAQYCGLYHTTMSFNVRVMARPAFARWLAEQEPAR